MIVFLQDILDIVHGDEFDEAVFRTYLSIGKELIESAAGSGSLGDIASSMLALTATFKSAWQLTTGHGMTNLWTAFRPGTAWDLESWHLLRRVECLTEKFDQQLWNFEVPLTKLLMLRKSIIAVHATVLAKGAAIEDELKVCPSRFHI